MKIILSKLFFIGQTLDEPLQRKTSKDCQSSTILGVCSNGAKIAVDSVQYGTKLTATCGLSDTSDGCCDYDSNDCLTNYSGTIQQDVCTGRDVCGGGNLTKGDTRSCGEQYPIQNHYHTMEYYCIPGSIRASTRKNCRRGLAYNKGADQPAHMRSLISTFVIRYLESIISRLASSEISTF